MKNQRRVGALDFGFRPEINRDALLPFLELFVKLADRIQKLAIGLLRCSGGVESLIHLALDSCKPAHRPEQIEFSSSISQRDIPNVVRRVATG